MATLCESSEKDRKCLLLEIPLASEHGRLTRGDHGLPKVLLRPAMPYPSTLGGWTTPKTALQLFQG
jgi:hypothetical protein